MDGLLSCLRSFLIWNIVKLALDARIRARVVVGINAIFILHQMEQLITVDEEPAVEIGINQCRLTSVFQIRQIVA